MIEINFGAGGFIAAILLYGIGVGIGLYTAPQLAQGRRWRTLALVVCGFLLAVVGSMLGFYGWVASPWGRL